MNKDAWKELYKIVHVNYTDGLFEMNDAWEIQDINGNKIGVYDNRTYARKQARYKYKKEIKKFEKLFTTLDEASSMPDRPQGSENKKV